MNFILNWKFVPLILPGQYGILIDPLGPDDRI